jgi:predicted ArsR family transcriptional regulator
MPTLEALLSDRKPRTAMEIAHALKAEPEDVYERLVSLEAKGITRLVYVKGSRKFSWRPEYKWEMVE